MFKPGKALESQVADLVGRLGRAAHCLQFAEGLNPAQWEALRFLARANCYSRSPTALAEYLGTTKGTASQTIRALEAKGYIARKAHARDKRVVALDLTAAGAALLGRDPIRQVESAAASLPPEIGEAVRNGLMALMGRLQSECGGTSFGICQQCGHLRGGEGAQKCGLNGDALSEIDREKLCVNFAPIGG
jgi:DNA-binding MarR family transcriptional regulator